MNNHVWIFCPIFKKILQRIDFVPALDELHKNCIVNLVTINIVKT